MSGYSNSPGSGFDPMFYVLENPNLNKSRKEYIGHIIDGCEVSDKDIEVAVGAALGQVPGILGLKSRLGDVFKNERDLSRGIHASFDDSYRVRVGARIIVDAFADPAKVMGDAAQAVLETIEKVLDLIPEKIEIEVADVMTKREFDEKHHRNPTMQAEEVTGANMPLA